MSDAPAPWAERATTPDGELLSDLANLDMGAVTRDIVRVCEL